MVSRQDVTGGAMTYPVEAWSENYTEVEDKIVSLLVEERMSHASSIGRSSASSNIINIDSFIKGSDSSLDPLRHHRMSGEIYKVSHLMVEVYW
ncbi:hypothetical protein QYM36_015914 [Artemia franciscana]|uniref:Uncharacterized protein n=1 Tax=Artemia franciscana TaxID=6661 RepID=A0AA88HII8_ARTSF|nr:hypothetical protein QYM36_015914 [Artemia franciscana]